MAAESPAKPSYLGLLNSISVGERNAGVFLSAWADATPDPELKRSLAFVASRESSHGEVFRQRIERLGFSLRERTEEDPEQSRRLAFIGDPSIPDVEKIRKNRADFGDGNANDAIARLEAHITDDMDPLTRATMRWYIEEERDTADLLDAEYARVLALE